MDDELKDLFFDAIDHFPLEQRDAAQRWLNNRVVLAKLRSSNSRSGGRVASRAQLIGSGNSSGAAFLSSAIRARQPRGVLRS